MEMQPLRWVVPAVVAPSSINCLLVGDYASGKTCITKRFTTPRDVSFSTEYEYTLGTNFDMKRIAVPLPGIRPQSLRIDMRIWDTVGTDQFASITSTYYTFANVCMCVYDVTNETSFKNVDKWVSRINRYATNTEVNMLVANKIDLVDQRVVSTNRGIFKAHSHGLLYMEVSAKDNTNIPDIFTVCARKFVCGYVEVSKPIGTLDGGWAEPI